MGVANIMVISLLERRSEVGLRRALGATKGHIRRQFLSEAILLALIGGAVSVGTSAFSSPPSTPPPNTEPSVLPSITWAGGIVAALIIGALAGLLPALRAARMSGLILPEAVLYL